MHPDESEPSTSPASANTSRFPAQLVHAAASLYYLDDANQAQIAQRLGTSRPTVSRLLAEARRRGIVRIDVLPPPELELGDLTDRTAHMLGLQAVHIGVTFPGVSVGAALAPALGEALTAAALQAGDVLLVSSGRTVYEAAQTRLPRFPGVHVAPTIGGQDEPEAWYQTNEITRAVALQIGGLPTFLYAPALPGPELHASLLREAAIGKVLRMWDQARCVVTGVAAPPLTRNSVPRFLPTKVPGLREAVGDVCARFYDRDGAPVPFEGSDRLMAISLQALRRVPVGIAVATGQDKWSALLAGARAGYYNRLVTDQTTAEGLVALAAASPTPSAVDAASLPG